MFIMSDESQNKPQDEPEPLLTRREWQASTPMLTAKEWFDYEFQESQKRKEGLVKLLELRANLAEKSTDKYITIAAAALGGTIYYVEKLSSQTSVFRAYPLLPIGCITLVMAIGGFLFVRTLNNRDIGAALEGNFDKSKSISEHSISLGHVARIALSIAILSITLFFLANFPTFQSTKGDKPYDKQQRAQDPPR